MSNYSGPVSRAVVNIRVIRTGKQSWYADKVGQVVKAMREVTVDSDGRQWASYRQWPSARGFEPSREYVAYEVEEVPKPSNNPKSPSSKGGV